MSETSPHPVLVVVDRVDRADRAGVLDVAADESRRRGRRLHLVHVVPASATALPDGARVLREARDGVRDRLGAGAGTSTELCHGPVVPSLVAESTWACLVVVGRDAGHPHGSVVERLAARSVAPVLVVPERAGPAHAPLCGVVTVGVDGTASDEHVLRAALEQALLRGAALRVVHAGPSSVASVREVYADLFAAWSSVDQDVVVTRGEAGEALLRHGLDADLVVVGRHEPWLPAGRLGPTTTTVLRAALCPVLVVGVPAMATVPLP